MDTKAYKRDYENLLRFHVERGRKKMSNGDSPGCPIGDDFPAIVLALGGYKLAEIEEGRNGRNGNGNSFEVSGPFGAIKARGKQAVSILWQGLLLLIILHCLGVIELPNLNGKDEKPLPVRVEEKHVKD